MWRAWNRIVVIACLVATNSNVWAETKRAGIGVIGDSYSDEYAFYPPDRSTSRNWVEILANVRGLDFGAYSPQGWGEPRNQGFAFNWARSDADTTDAIVAGQHLGLASQLARGEVGTAIVFAGGNDFIHALASDDPSAALTRVLPIALANYRVIVETLRKASPDAQILLVTVPDILDLPEFQSRVRDGRIPRAVVDLCRSSIRTFNAEVRELAGTSETMGLLDLDGISRLAIPLGRGRALIGGRVLDREVPSNAADHLFLADSRHMGTYGQAMFAKLILDAINARFHWGIKPLTFHDVQRIADRGAESLRQGAGGRPEAIAAGRARVPRLIPLLGTAILSSPAQQR